MGKIVYECHFYFHFLFLIPFILLIGTIFVFHFYPEDLKKKGFIPASEIKIVKKIFLCAIIIECIVIIVCIMSQIDLYKETVVAYRNGDYQIVEGYVENFDPMPSYGHKYETFEINGVKFGYSDYTLMIGYHNAKSHGGVITRNGQYFKIGYVRYGNENVIVYIEQYPEKRDLDLEASAFF